MAGFPVVAVAAVAAAGGRRDALTSSATRAKGVREKIKKRKSVIISDTF